jgi:hypothetical protein
MDIALLCISWTILRSVMAPDPFTHVMSTGHFAVFFNPRHGYYLERGKGGYLGRPPRNSRPAGGCLGHRRPVAGRQPEICLPARETGVSRACERPGTSILIPRTGLGNASARPRSDRPVRGAAHSFSFGGAQARSDGSSHLPGLSLTLDEALVGVLTLRRPLTRS